MSFLSKVLFVLEGVTIARLIRANKSRRAHDHGVAVGCSVVALSSVVRGVNEYSQATLRPQADVVLRVPPSI